MWADDCVVLSTSAVGLQRAMEKTSNYFQELGLTVNTKKTKVMIYSPSGHGPEKFKNLIFSSGGQIIEKVDSYTYFGLVFKPSGSVVPAIK